MERERWTLAAASRKIGVSRAHLAWAMLGRVRPNDRVRRRLPLLLNCSLLDLFTEEAVEQPHRVMSDEHREKLREGWKRRRGEAA
jgi:transcriptional regulator with XRE-family HTH domain